MLRLVVAALVVANLVFFAWTSGWLAADLLGPPPGDDSAREPHRSARQVRPELITLVDAEQARALAALRCVQAGPFDEAGFAGAAAAVEAAAIKGLAWQRQAAAEEGQHWLRVDAADATQRQALSALASEQAGLEFGACP